MDLYNHVAPAFTRWIVADKLLRDPFVVIDAGVQGGEHPRWQNLGEFVHVYGFDPIQEVIESLNAANRGRPNRTYYPFALGNENGQREFHVAADTCGSSFYGSRVGQSGEQNGISIGSRTVEIRRLDSLFADGKLPPADYIKIDCEGFDPEVLRGARNYLAHSNVLCVTVETNFGVSPIYPRTPFADINDLLVEHRLLVFDVNFIRAPRPSYVAARAKAPWPAADPMQDHPDLDVGQPRTFDFVFCRDLVYEHTTPHAYMTPAKAIAQPTIDMLIKSMINFELHGLMDCAVDVAEHFRPMLAERLDVDTAISHLVQRPPYTRNTAEVTSALALIAKLRSQAHDSEAKRIRVEQNQKLGLVKFLAPAPVAQIKPKAPTLVLKIGSKIWRGLGFRKLFGPGSRVVQSLSAMRKRSEP